MDFVVINNKVTIIMGVAQARRYLALETLLCKNMVPAFSVCHRTEKGIIFYEFLKCNKTITYDWMFLDL